MRRASLVAPLLLIGIGLLFLARNIFPELQLLDYLAKYWPLLLVVWGGLRLLEILFWAATSRPLPAHGISGGEWVLVIFLCFRRREPARRARILAPGCRAAGSNWAAWISSARVTTIRSPRRNPRPRLRA